MSLFSGGPIGPSTQNPKFNVLVMYGLIGFGVALGLLFALSGAWRWSALGPFILGVGFFTGALRAGIDPPHGAPERDDA